MHTDEPMASRKTTLAERVNLYLAAKGEDVFLVRAAANEDQWQICEIEKGEVVIVWHEDEKWSYALQNQLIELNRMFDDEKAASKAWHERQRRTSDEA